MTKLPAMATDRAAPPARSWLRALPWIGLVALLPWLAAAEALLVAMAVAGIVLSWRDHRRGLRPFAGDGLRWVAVAFGAYWLPQLCSAVDSIDPARSWNEVLVDLRYLPFLLLAARPAALPWTRIRDGISLVIALWCIDALVQATFGVGLGGHARVDRVSGIFGDDNLKLGPVVAVFSPFLLLAAADRAGRLGAFAALALLTATVLLAGSRASWLILTLATVAVAFGILRGPAASDGFRHSALIGIIVVAAVAAVVALGSTRFDARIARSEAALSGDFQGVDHALSGRVSIWQAGVAMAADHPFNGVGSRGFRTAYPAYARPDDPWRREGTVALHPHQLLLELLTETGVFGLALWVAAAGILTRAWRRATTRARLNAQPAAIAAVALLFPLNTHPAFYSSFWGMVLMLLVALVVAALTEPPAA